MERLEAAVFFCKKHGLIVDFREQPDVVFVSYEHPPYVLSAQGHDLVAAVVALRKDMETVGIIKEGRTW